MADIGLFNSAGRDAVVKLQSLASPMRVRWLDPTGRQVSSARIVKSSLANDLDGLVEQHGDLRSVGAAIRDSDPEVDVEISGRMLQETTRVFIDRTRQIAHRVQEWEIVRNPDGSERQRRVKASAEANIGTELPPLKWSGILIPKLEAIRKFVFVQHLQLAHINGLTYDFLYGMAKELEAKNSLMLVGAGPKSNQPLVLRRNAAAYRGFLEGRTRGDSYRLILHLSNLELKAPETTAESGEEKGS